MANKRINELALRTPQTTDLMLIGDPTTGYSYKTTLLSALNLGVPTTRTLTINGTTYDLSANRTWSVGTVTSVGLTMPSAFNVASSPVTGSGTIAVTAAGLASQYIRGDGTLADFPGGGGGGGASVSYYLNGSVNQGTIGGVTYYEMNKTPIFGAGTNFTTSSNGYIASFITDAGDPALLKIPGGNWNTEFYFAASSGGGTPTYYLELYKYDGTTFTLIASSSSNPDTITGGTSVEQYFTTIAVPETVLTATDRLAIRIYVTTAGRTITLHTENSNLCQIITTFTTGLTALNGLTAQVQYFATGTTGTDFNISSSTATHTFNIPTASATNRGALSSADWTTFNNKVTSIIAGNAITVSNASGNVVTVNHADTSGADPGATISGSNVFRSIVLDTYGHVTGLSYSSFLISDLGGTAISSPSNGQVLSYNGTNWVNSSLSGLSIITGSGTTNYLPKFTGTSTIGNSLVFDNGTSVGIGTASPADKLQISDGRLRFLESGQRQWNIGIESGTPDFRIREVTFGFTPLTINGSGNVLVNTTTDNLSGAKLQVSGAAIFSGNITINASATSGLFLTPTSGSESPNVTFVSSTNQYNIDNSGGNLRFFTEDVGGGNGVVRATLNASGNLGIGTTSPTNKIQIENSIATTYSSSNTLAGGVIAYIKNSSTTNSTDATIRIETTGAGNLAAASISAVHTGSGSSALTFGTRLNSNDVTERLRLDASGNLGLGVTPSAWSTYIGLQIGSGSSIAGRNDGLPITLYSSNTYFDGTNYRYILSKPAVQYVQDGNGGNHWWSTAPSGTAGNAITFTQAMTLDASGNLFVGGVHSALAATRGIAINGGSTNDVQFRLQNNNTGTSSSDGALLSLASDNSMYLYNYENAAINFGTNNTIRATITSAGRLLLGTTTDNTVDRLQVAGTVAFNGESVIDGNNWLLRSAAANTDLVINYNGKSGASLIFYSGTTTRFKVTSAGRVNMPSLPTSSAGLSAGDLWNDGGTVKIV